MSGNYRTCTACGAGFRTAGGVGRPPTRCDRCRGVLRSDDSAWRLVKAQVLREEPICAVRGCGRPSATVDHIIPLSKGGSRLDRANLQGMCGPHNFAKGDRLPMPVAPELMCQCRDAFHGPDGCRTPRPHSHLTCLPCRYFACDERSVS